MNAKEIDVLCKVFVLTIALFIILPISDFSSQSNPPGTLYSENNNNDTRAIDPEYHSFIEVYEEMNETVVDHSDIAKKIVIGTTVEGRDILAMKISDNVNMDEDEPGVCFIGLHHAREPLTVEVCMHLIKYFTDNYGVISNITYLVDNREIWIIPMLNVDGHIYDNSGGSPGKGLYWRKNRRDNGDGTFGVDPNRNYAYKWGGASTDTSSNTYQGPYPFSEPETQAIRDFTLTHNFSVCITYHTYSELILYPWGHTGDHVPSPDYEIFDTMGNEMNDRMTNKYTVQQACELYATTGDTTDWMYGELGIFAFTFELYPENDPPGFYPPGSDIPMVCDNNEEPAVYLTEVAIDPYQVIKERAESKGNISFDREMYEYCDAAVITLTDKDLNLDPNVIEIITVNLTSSTETTPETITLTEMGMDKYQGFFQGKIDLASGKPRSDGTLQVRGGDTIEVVYEDIDDGTGNSTEVIEIAVIDVLGPVITDVKVTNITHTSAEVTWTTDEGGNSTVYYGNTTSLGLIAEDENLPWKFKTSHSVLLTGLISNTTYYFDVESIDRLADVTRDDFGSAHYTFSTVKNPVVLLVDDDGGDDFEKQYESSLEDREWIHARWDHQNQGSPALDVLQSSKVTVWHCCDGYPTLNATDRAVLSDYLDNGGRLFITGQDLGWDLCDPGGGEYSTEAKTWYETYLHAIFNYDDATGYPWSGYGSIDAIGISDDPISGAYTSGEPLTDRFGPGRMFPDDISTNAGSIECWDYSNSPYHTPDLGSVRYDGGTPEQRIVYYAFAFEFLGGDPNPDPTRTDILDKSIVWLLGDNDHPNVIVNQPNGGEVWSGVKDITWSAADGETPSANLLIDIEYSDDEGQTWYGLIYGTENDGAYTWDTSAVQNGNRYLIKVTAEDDGVISLKGEDLSNDVFTIDNGAGGDSIGPMVVAGSAKATPNPTNDAALARINATIDDSRKGDSSIISAEYWSSYDPVHHPMSAYDSSFDSSIEAVTATINVSEWNYGVHTIWVRGQDASGNWGAALSTRLTINVFKNWLSIGQNLISIPLIQDDVNLTMVLESINGSYDAVKYYNAADANGKWQTHATFKPEEFNELSSVNNSMAIWINMLKNDTLIVYGAEPTSTAIPLYKGWNFVGYPSITERNVSEALEGIPYEQVEGFNDSPPYYLRILKENDKMKAGSGYWILIKENCTWSIEW